LRVLLRHHDVCLEEMHMVQVKTAKLWRHQVLGKLKTSDGHGKENHGAVRLFTRKLIEFGTTLII